MTALLKIVRAPSYVYEELWANATQVCGPYWLFEGDSLAIGIPQKYVVAEGATPVLGDQSRAELIAICETYLGYTIPPETEININSYFMGQPPPNLYRVILADLEEPLFAAALEYTNGNQSQAARLLGLNRVTFRKRIKKYGLR